MKWLLALLLLIYGQQLFIIKANASEHYPKLTQLLKGTPLQGQEENFINDSYDFGIDYKLLVSIAGVESGFCRQDFGSKNCFGLLSGGKLIHFSSYRDSIWYTAKLLYRNYNGAKDLQAFAKIYCGSTCKDYPSRLDYFKMRL